MLVPEPRAGYAGIRVRDLVPGIDARLRSIAPLGTSE